jgi:transitional endoplasmic reticulum ATPase
MPSQKDRLEILQVHCKNLNRELQVELNKVAEITPGYVGADLSLLCFEASMLSAVRIIGFYCCTFLIISKFF